MYEKLIQKWLSEGTINKEQANVMLADIKNEKKSISSGKLITSISVIGAVLLGLGAITLMASNWQTMSSIVKVLILVGSTFTAYISGYILKYEKKTLPKVGSALLFLGGLLIGASLFLIAQIYHINANIHVLILIWIMANLPLVYAFHSMEIAGLVAVLFFIWIPSFIYQNIIASQALSNIAAFPILYLVSAIFLFGLGGLHYINNSLSKVARIYRLIALSVILTSLFLLTFNTFSGSYTHRYGGSYSVVNYLRELTPSFKTWVTLTGIAGFIMAIANYGMELSEKRVNLLEIVFSSVLIACGLLLTHVPSNTNIYMYLFNLSFIGLVGSVVYFGFEREDAQLTDMGLRCAGVFILAKYFDFFWDLMPRSIFFIIGGLILVYGGIYLERVRANAQNRFKRSQVTNGQ